jgi:hypothetical protein
MSKQAVTKIVTPAVRRFTIDGVSKYSFKGVKTLIELMSLFPNYGMGFRIWRKTNKNEYFILDKINIKNNRNAELFGIPHKDGVPSNKIEKIRSTQQDIGWNYEPLTTKCYTDNGVEYDIKRMEELIAIKKKVIEKRNTLLGLPHPLKAIKEEIKKKKLEATAKPKKR